METIAKMKDLFNPILAEETKQRILQLRHESERQWGSMAVAQLSPTALLTLKWRSDNTSCLCRVSVASYDLSLSRLYVMAYGGHSRIRTYDFHRVKVVER